MPKTEAELFAFLADLGISVSTVRHQPLYTVADSQSLRGEIPGGHTKNLFLKDKKDNFFLVSVGEDAVVDLKQIHTIIGAASRVSFGKPEMLMELLGVIPGAVTVFGLINDDANPVGLVHLGVVHLVELDRPRLDPREDALADPEFVDVADLPALRDQFETWSQICIDAVLS